MGRNEFILIVLIVILPLSALYDLVCNRPVTTNKTIWAIVIVGMPFVGPVLYLLVTRFRLLTSKQAK